jgi:hypothetical protein
MLSSQDQLLSDTRSGTSRFLIDYRTAQPWNPALAHTSGG